MMKILFIILTFILCASSQLTAQVDGDETTINFGVQKEYEIGGITISGTQYLNESIIITLSGLTVGDKIVIPGEHLATAIESLWKQGLFANVKIYITKVIDGKVFLDIQLQERPRLCSFNFRGIKKSEIEDIREKIRLIRGKVITENVKITTNNIIEDYYFEKGYLNTTIIIHEKPDTSTANCLTITIEINKGKKIKIDEVSFTGNDNVKEKKLQRLMKGTKQRGFFKIFNTSRYNKSDYSDDKMSVINYYNSKGYRDAIITSDTVYTNTDGNLIIKISLNEGSKYYFGNITWKGNAKFTDERLSAILNIEKGKVYDNDLLEKRLYMNQSGVDISSLYMDDGYLFFQATPIEIAVENDSIDIEINIYEGPQATINKVTIAGNTKTNEHVIRRELRTLPGNKFSRADIIRSQREIATLGYFNAENLGVNPIPHPEQGTVDIEYVVEEKPADQIEMSMGWGGIGLVGSFGVSFTNFSVKNIFKKGTWLPLPSGDGQRLSLRAQANAKYYHSFSASFTEPWLGGKKPNSFTISLYRSVQSNGVKKKDESPTRQRAELVTTGGSIGIGIRLSFPDDYFTLMSSLNVQHFKLDNWFSRNFIFQNGESYNLSLQETLSRNSLDQPLFPRYGSAISLTSQVTFPYSMFDQGKFKDPALDPKIKYKWVEYHKWKFKSEWYTPISGNFVLKASAKMGFLGFYNKDIGHAPFERFEVGGNGLSNFALYGIEIVSSRGHDQFTPSGGATIFNKYTLELRYPISLKPMSTIYALAFVEGVNAWMKFKEFDPFGVKRSAGIGLRVYLPMFGLLGFDLGTRFEPTSIYDTRFVRTNNIWEFITSNSRLNVILGFEPE